MSGVLEFAPGETSKQIVVKILNDSIWEQGTSLYERFAVQLQDPTGAVLGSSLSYVTIQDVDKDQVREGGASEARSE